MKSLALLILFAIPPGVMAQQKPDQKPDPNANTCAIAVLQGREDAKWLDKGGLDKYTFDELGDKAAFLGDCHKARLIRSDDATALMLMYSQEQTMRYSHYVKTHHLVEQFLKEEAEGKR